MRDHLRSLTWASLGLAVVLSMVAAASADSPKWADAEMLLPWPATLGETLPSVDRRRGRLGVSPSAAGRVMISDLRTDAERPTVTAGWSSDAVGRSNETTRIAPALPVPAATTASHQVFDGGRPMQPVRSAAHRCRRCDDWRILPDGLLFNSYLAGEKEPRMAAAFLREKDRGTVFEATIGGRVGLLRYGTAGPSHPEGWQWDLEGAAMLRQDVQQELDVEAADFRVGSVITWRQGPTAVKFGYYHLSSHLGDEFLLRNPTFPRLNHLRDSLLIAVHHHVSDALGVYGEIAYAVRTDGGAEPLELQFGAEYTPWDMTRSSGTPVLAVNGHLREEFDFGGSVNVIAGWQWRGTTSNRQLRIGAQYYNGKEIQWSFFDESVEFVGGGIWYDF